MTRRLAVVPSHDAPPSRLSTWPIASAAASDRRSPHGWRFAQPDARQPIPPPVVRRRDRQRAEGDARGSGRLSIHGLQGGGWRLAHHSSRSAQPAVTRPVQQKRGQYAQAVPFYAVRQTIRPPACCLAHAFESCEAGVALSYESGPPRSDSARYRRHSGFSASRMKMSRRSEWRWIVPITRPR
jgi:hypothetical protein